MLISRKGATALAVAAALSPPVLSEEQPRAASVQSTFVSPDKSLSFAFSVPEDEDNDFYFTLRVHRDFSWGAVGLGTDDMPGALIFMIYDNRNGESVTFSPRLANGHYEPQYYPQLEVDELPGTGIISEKYMVYQGRCRKNCRTWPLRGNTFGSIDVNSTTQKAIWALGMMEDFASDKPWEGIKYHQQYGTFTIDMARTHGATEPPTLDGNSRNEGTTLDDEHLNKSDVQSTMHAVFMILAIVGLMPLAVVLLRLGGAVKWHALIQAISLVFVLAGLAMGIMTSFRYTRSQKFNSYHQVLGFLLTAFFLCQYAIGYFNHRQYRQTGIMSKYNAVHVWFGRIVILIAIMNAFFGFTFALNRRYGMVLAGLIIMVCVASLIVIIGRQWLDKRRGTTPQRPYPSPRSPYNDSPPTPNQHGPNRAQWPSGMDYFPSEPPPRYESTLEDDSVSQRQTIGLRPLSSRRNSRPGDPRRNDPSTSPGIGGTQSPRELL
ncbi:unnamed protein product [Clonostachys rosea]|uniref:Cytochrome b561 domain-containing protein n=1 Tax=Bionectria ochroleuca TaxID=29856 RepID=A0ABY6TVG9_BIOOC|nr:unnamed protein product [Clonostachys rosea]